ncbi:MAG: alpha/beta hydrolase family protein [Limisphaerales bacterium]
MKKFLLLTLLPLAMNAAEFTEVSITSTKDGKPQKAFWWHPENAKKQPVPLLVILHTWSGNYQQKSWKEPGLKESEKRGWAVIHPDFRGRNNTPQACGSDYAVQDVLDAVAWAKKQIKVDTKRIYLTGTSGGGHMSLLMAGRAPKIWAGVSSWVPISDVAQWHRDTTAAGRTKYASDLVKCCGGKPGESEQVDAEYVNRSPLTWLSQAKGVAIDINAGVHDGHTGSVPCAHSLRAFNSLAVANGNPDVQVAKRTMDLIWKNREVPKSQLSKPITDEQRKRDVLLRRSAGPVRVTIFEGGHEGDMTAAIHWLAQQKKK